MEQLFGSVEQYLGAKGHKVKTYGKMRYKNCGRHPGEQLNLVCLNRDCAGLICQMCREQNHYGHQTKPVRLLLDQVQQHSSGLKCRPIVPLLPFYQNLMQTLQTYVTLLSSQILRLEQLLQTHYTLARDKQFYDNYNRQNLVAVIRAMMEQGEDVAEDLKALVDGFGDVGIPNQTYVGTQYQEVSNSILNLLRKFKREACGSIQQTISKVESAIIGLSRHAEQAFKFSSHLRPASINISSLNTAIQTCNPVFGEKSFVLIEPQLSLFKKASIEFKILNRISWIAVGICEKQVILNSNFAFKAKGKHGTYMISDNGYSWSCSNEAQDKVKKSFQFTTGDIIRVEFNPITNQIIFLKHKQSFILGCKPKTDSILHFCVNLNGIDESIMIVT